MRPKVILSVLAGLALLLSVGVAMNADAQPFGPLGGPAVLFPYVIKDDPNVITVVNVVVPDYAGENLDAAQLHYTYIYKSKTAKQTDSCDDWDFPGKTSPNDFLTFDVSGMIDGGKPLFSDTTSGAIGPTGLNLTVPASEGFLIVEVLDKSGAGVPLAQGICTTATANMNLCYPHGEAYILDLVNGGAWGYKGFTGFWNDARLMYNDIIPTMIFPPSIATTQFVITPMSYGLLSTRSQDGVYLGYDIDLLKAQAALIQPIARIEPPMKDKVFDRNEIAYSSTSEKKVVCVGIATLDELVSSGILNSPVFKAQGAWGWLWNKPFTGDTDNDAFIYKVESSSILGKFMLNAMPNGSVGD